MGQPPFVVLDVRGRHRSANGRELHVLSLAGGKTLRLGRGHRCDLRLEDASISRWHATLRADGHRILLEDHESKFGTLVEVQRPISVDASSSVSVQVGRTVLQLSPADGALASEGTLPHANSES